MDITSAMTDSDHFCSCSDSSSLPTCRVSKNISLPVGKHNDCRSNCHNDCFYAFCFLRHSYFLLHEVHKEMKNHTCQDRPVAHKVNPGNNESKWNPADKEVHHIQGVDHTVDTTAGAMRPISIRPAPRSSEAKIAGIQKIHVKRYARKKNSTGLYR